MGTSRTRQRSALLPVYDLKTAVDQTCTSGTVTGPSRLVGWNGTRETTTDVVTPDFWKRAQRGEFINNPYSHRLETYSINGSFPDLRFPALPGVCGGVRKYYEQYHNSDIVLPLIYGNIDTAVEMPVRFLAIDSDVQSAISVAATKAWSASKGHSAGILEDIAEYHQTFGLLRDPLQKGHSFINRIRYKNWSKVERSSLDALDYANSLWLQYRFGIRPILSDINAVLEEFAKPKRPRRVTGRGKYSLTYYDGSRGGTLGTSSCEVDYTYVDTHNVEIRCGVVVDEFVSMAQALGLDASSMLALPWELVPYSFVADWFANVQDFFLAAIPFLTQSPLSQWTTVRHYQNTLFQCTDTRALTGVEVINPADVVRESTVITTTRVPSIQGPGIAFKPQSLSGVITDLRLIDSFALLVQKLDRVFKH